jgi:hypothetical protein
MDRLKKRTTRFLEGWGGACGIWAEGGRAYFRVAPSFEEIEIREYAQGESDDLEGKEVIRSERNAEDDHEHAQNEENFGEPIGKPLVPSHEVKCSEKSP